MPFTEDLTQFYKTADFATAVTYKAGGTGNGTTINGHFDSPNQEHLGITGTHPTLRFAATDVPSFSIADTFTIGSTVYRGVNSEPLDDGAEIRIQLEKQ